MSKLDKLQEAEGMKGLPKGWTQKSLMKFSKSLTGKEGTKEKFFERCVEKMQGKIDNPEGFCASVKDELHGSTYWRGKGKTPQEAGKDVKAHQNVKQEHTMKPLVENFLKHLYTDMRPHAEEWNGPNIPVGDDSDRPNLVRKCLTFESNRMKINCLRKLQDAAAMNPQYRVKIDRWVDAITQTYEPTDQPGTIPGNEFKETGVREDLKESYIQEGIIRYKGKTFKVDDEGFLLSPNDYSKKWVEYTSAQIGIKKLTPKHLKVIDYVRSYYLKNKIFPMLRMVMSANGVDLKTLYILFPKGPIYSLGRLTGFPYKIVERLNK